MLHRTALPLFACLVALLVAPVLAQEDDFAPPLRSDHGIDYRTGGVGADERDALYAATGDYGLKLVFAAKDKSDYLAEVDVKITDAKGEPAFEASDTGPYLFVKLPPGKYSVTATHGGRAQTQRVTVSRGKQTSAGFYW